MNVAQPIEWTSQGVVMLDQRRLPGEVIHHIYTDYREVAAAIKDMVIRGAPAIGVAAAMGVALGVERSSAATLDELRAKFPVHLPDDRRNAPDGRGLVLGHRTHEAPLRPTRLRECIAGYSPSRNGGGSARGACRKARHG